MLITNNIKLEQLRKSCFAKLDDKKKEALSKSLGGKQVQREQKKSWIEKNRDG